MREICLAPKSIRREKKRKVEKISLQTKIEIIQEVAKGVKVVDLATRYGE